MLGKIRVSISIEEEVRDRAQMLGLNVSRVCENALRDTVKRLEQKETEQ